MLPAALILALAAQTAALPPPANTPALYTTLGRGVQIYACTDQASGLAWSLKAPDAKLYDRKTGKQVATHSAGPRWTWTDGSTITGKLLEKTPSPDRGSVAWLLLAADHTGSPAGALADVAYIRRTETRGGNPPATGCNPAHAGATISIPYSATYSFYAAPSK